MDAKTPRPHGTLFLVVGPSGAGKDSLIDAARVALAGRMGVAFAQRVISRAADAGGEAHRAVTTAEFRRLKADGAFLLAWEAHDTHYGIPASVDAELARGLSVVANVSRTVVQEARQRFASVRVIEVTAPPEILAQRLAQRGREGAADVAARLRRAPVPGIAAEDVTTIVNDGDLAEAAARFIAALATGSGGGLL